MTRNEKIIDRVRRYILGRLPPAQMKLFERELAQGAEYPNPLFGKPGMEGEPETLPLIDWVEGVETELVEGMLKGTLEHEDAAAFSAYAEQGDKDRKDRIGDLYKVAMREAKAV